MVSMSGTLNAANQEAEPSIHQSPPPPSPGTNGSAWSSAHENFKANVLECGDLAPLYLCAEFTE